MHIRRPSPFVRRMPTARLPAGRVGQTLAQLRAQDHFERTRRSAPSPKGGAAFDPHRLAERTGPLVERAVERQAGKLAGRVLERLGRPGQILGKLLAGGLDLTSVVQGALGFIPVVGPVLRALSAIPGVGGVVRKLVGGLIGALKKVPGLGHVLRGADKVLGWAAKGVRKAVSFVGKVAKKGIKAVAKGLKKIGGFFKRLF